MTTETEGEVFRTNKGYLYMELTISALLCFIIIGIPLVIGFIIGYKTTRITADKNGVTYRHGLLMITETHIPYSRINNIMIKTSLVDGLMGAGQITILTGNDSEKINIYGLDRPRELKAIIDSHIQHQGA